MKGGLRTLGISRAFSNKECPQFVLSSRYLYGIHFVVKYANHVAIFDNENLAFVFTR